VQKLAVDTSSNLSAVIGKLIITCMLFE